MFSLHEVHFGLMTFPQSIMEVMEVENDHNI